MLIGTSRRKIGVAVLAMALTFGLAAPTEAAHITVPMTRLDDVERQVEKLQAEAALAAEEWNEARIALAQVNRRIAALSKKSLRQQERYKDLSRDLDGIIRSLYKSGGIDLDIQAMIATDPAGFLTRLDAISIVGVRQEASLRRILAANIDLKQSKAELKVEQKTAAKLAAKSNERRRTVESKLASAEKLLNSLQAADRKKRAARLAALKKAQALKAKKAKQAVISAKVSARLRSVLKYALRQVGDRYSMGASGPSSYDCSGLTMMSYRQVGVSLSHYSMAQWSQTKRVSRSQLRPGDLVFFFRGIRHVGMYIGNNNFVHAASYGSGVIVSSLSESYYRARLSGFGRVIR